MIYAQNYVQVVRVLFVGTDNHVQVSNVLYVDQYLPSWTIHKLYKYEDI